MRARLSSISARCKACGDANVRLLEESDWNNDWTLIETSLTAYAGNIE
jgi:hypothetical protein